MRVAGWRESLAMICPTTKAEYFCVRDWTVDSGLIGKGKFDFWRNAFCVIPATRECIRVVIPGRERKRVNPESIAPLEC